MVLTTVAGRRRLALRARVAGAHRGPDRPARRRAAVGVAGLPAAAGQPGPRLGLGVAAHRRPAGRRPPCCAPLWVRTEVRSDAPLIDMRMMRIPAVWTTNLVSLLFGVGMYAGYAFIPQFLQTPERAGYGFGASVTVSGLLLLPQSLATFAAGLLSGRLAARHGSKRLLAVGAALSAVSQLGLALVHDSVVAGAGRHRRRRVRLRPGLRRDVQPGRRGRPAVADRRRQRHERQHPHGRRRDRRRRARLRRDGRRAGRRPAGRGRLHPRLRRARGLLRRRRRGRAARAGAPACPSPRSLEDEVRHPELAVVASGTLVSDAR